MPPFLADATFWVAVACSLVAQVAIVRAAFLVRDGDGHAPAGAAPPTPRLRRSREVMWTVVPGVVLALVLYFTWRAVHPLPPTQTASAVAAGVRA